jgi:hypothetical protein
VTNLLHQVRHAMGGNLSVAGVWSAIIGALTKTTPGIVPVIGDNNARRTLGRICAWLDGSRDLILELAGHGAVPGIVVRAANHRLTPRDLEALETLRRGLDGISAPRWCGLTGLARSTSARSSRSRIGGPARTPFASTVRGIACRQV